MTGGNEIITLQFGALANATGATFWNSQDALFQVLLEDEWKEYGAFLNAEVLHTTHDSRRTGVKHTPRLVIVDDALQSGGNAGVVDSPVPEVTTWGGSTEIYHTSANSPSAPPQSTDPRGASTQDRSFPTQWSWNTIAQVEFNPKSLALAPRGSGLFDPSRHAEEIEEKIRYFAENCDNVQGFHVALDEGSEWGLQACDTLRDLQDSFPNRPSTLFLQNSNDMSEIEQGALKARLLVRRGITLGQLSQHCNLVVPLAKPHSPSVSTVDNLQLSVLHAMAWDCVSLPYRFTEDLGQHARSNRPSFGSPIGMSDMKSYCDLFCGSGSPLVSFSARPYPAVGNGNDPTQLTRTGFFSLSPLTEPWDPETTVESLIWRGPANGLSRLRSTQALETLDASLASERFRCVRHRSIFPMAAPLALPYHSTAYVDLEIFDSSRRPFGELDIDGVPLLSRLRSSAMFDAVVLDISKGFSAGARSAWGKGELERWGLEVSECDVVTDALSDLTREGGGSSDDDMSF
ncbi:hypothetical protein BSKO_06147 [Bryopsis sp. KO-2023]|nr:hypothetical protein BSKO_06147 [Bryopsis sp. KO-2023]